MTKLNQVLFPNICIYFFFNGWNMIEFSIFPQSLFDDSNKQQYNIFKKD